MHTSVKFFIILTMIELLLAVSYSEGRYLPTRGHGDNLEKLRELMYQILESSDENLNDPQQVPQQQQQQQRLTYSRHPSWTKQSLAETDLPQLFGSSKSRYGGIHSFDSDRLYP